MIGSCASLTDEGMIRGVLATVDCHTRVFSEVGYQALSAGSSTFQLAVTALLTIYVAVIGYRMLFASRGARLSQAPGIALKIGAVLALITSWSTFETVVFNTANRAPMEIAGIVSAPLQSGASRLAADPVAGLQTAYDDIKLLETAFGKVAGSASVYASPEAGAAEALSTATGVLFLSTAGVVAAALLVIGVLTAVGPVFIALFLLPSTRGLFVGWLRALAAAAFVMMVTWLLIVILLSVLDPWLDTLLQQKRDGALNPETAMSAASLVFVFAAGEVALVISALVMALGFHLPRPARAAAEATSDDRAEREVAPPHLTTRAQRLAWDLQRDQNLELGRAQRTALSGGYSAQARVLPAPGANGAGSDSSYRRPNPISRRGAVA